MSSRKPAGFLASSTTSSSSSASRSLPVDHVAIAVDPRLDRGSERLECGDGGDSLDARCTGRHIRVVAINFRSHDPGAVLWPPEVGGLVKIAEREPWNGVDRIGEEEIVAMRQLQTRIGFKRAQLGDAESLPQAEVASVRRCRERAQNINERVRFGSGKGS